MCRIVARRKLSRDECSRTRRISGNRALVYVGFQRRAFAPAFTLISTTSATAAATATTTATAFALFASFWRACL
jgi:hypothetical protein